ncbi:hypothetical protein [Kitasatospora sp. NPDC050543]|uniref:hypothetical protein n=1 Tax=Kitasatospora sp. NPDC050543 TaxID=3364054 RepID=UPI0037A82C3F
MPSFHDRKAIGDAHERRVTLELNHRGWDVSPWGQGVMGEPVRLALRSTDSFLRWTPDLIAAREKQIVMIDCKSRMTSRTSSRHAIENAAVTAHLQLVAWTRLPLYYAFDNLDLLTPGHALGSGTHGPRTAAGSGAPYLLVPTDRALAFDRVFGPPRPASLPDAA